MAPMLSTGNINPDALLNVSQCIYDRYMSRVLASSVHEMKINKWQTLQTVEYLWGNKHLAQDTVGLLICSLNHSYTELVEWECCTNVKYTL